MDAKTPSAIAASLSPFSSSSTSDSANSILVSCSVMAGMKGIRLFGD
jgi:hypothetical protein